jgi:hypothetical protein
MDGACHPSLLHDSTTHYTAPRWLTDCYATLDPPPPPPDPPPPVLPYPPNSLLDKFSRPLHPLPVTIELQADQTLASRLTKLSPCPSVMDSVTHVVCNSWICGLCGNSTFYIRILWINGMSNWMVNRGSNICVTGDLGTLLNVININPIIISVALDGAPSSIHR